MATTLMTPGVYIEERNAFPSSAVAVETAVPVFIGYTARAERNGKSLLRQPTRIASLAEYHELFGGAFKPVFTVATTTTPNVDSFTINGVAYAITLKDNHTAYFYNSIRLFYANGGGDCYIMSVGTYGDSAQGLEIKMEDFVGTDTMPDVFTLLENENEPTLIVFPDAIGLKEAAYPLYQKVLAHCAKMQSRFGIFDLALQTFEQTTKEVSETFRTAIGINFLNYGAAYYPWLRASVVQSTELDFENLDAATDLDALLPAAEEAAKKVVENYKALADDKKDEAAKRNYHQSLKASSPTYTVILSELRRRANMLPPSAAMAGIYSAVDGTRGVWKAPANVSLTMVDEPLQHISHDQQEKLNIDVIAGKSINVIRPFPGVGTLVWGARTLDGNSQDWRYINVRRTLIMMEQSIKLATRAYVFEPNTSATWVTISSMIGNFLFNLWKGGALAGSEPAQAYDVQIGLGSTMTPTDVLDGIMRITVKVAVVRPAEFIVITFQQQQQQS